MDVNGPWSILEERKKHHVSLNCDRIARKLPVLSCFSQQFPSLEDGNGVLDFEETVILMHVYRWEWSRAVFQRPENVADELTKLWTTVEPDLRFSFY